MEMQRKFSPSNSTFPNRVEIDRIHWKNLSLKTFFYKYAKNKKAVVIEGLPISKTPWTLRYISQNVEITP